MSFPTLDYGYDLSACLDQAVSKYVVLKRFLFDGPSCFQTWIVPKWFFFQNWIMAMSLALFWIKLRPFFCKNSRFLYNGPSCFQNGLSQHVFFTIGLWLWLILFGTCCESLFVSKRVLDFVFFFKIGFFSWKIRIFKLIFAFRKLIVQTRFSPPPKRSLSTPLCWCAGR